MDSHEAGKLQQNQETRREMASKRTPLPSEGITDSTPFVTVI